MLPCKGKSKEKTSTMINLQLPLALNVRVCHFKSRGIHQKTNLLRKRNISSRQQKQNKETFKSVRPKSYETTTNEQQTTTTTTPANEHILRLRNRPELVDDSPSCVPVERSIL